MKYDDASWHSDGDFPVDLQPEAGATHIAMFVVWCWLNGMAGPLHDKEMPKILEKIQARMKTPGMIFISACDEKFMDEDLNEEGNAFAQSYYAADAGTYVMPKGYISDYEGQFPGVPSLYHVPDTWETYDLLAPVIARRHVGWKNKSKGWLSGLWPPKT